MKSKVKNTRISVGEDELGGFDDSDNDMPLPS
jgi:hypothetical protein